MFNPGSCGLTDDGAPGACYASLENKNGGWICNPIKVSYDYEKTIENVKSNPDLIEKSKGWGKLLIKSVKTGINVTALYMFELKRLNNIYYNNNQNMEKTLYVELENFKEAFGQGRYGNLNPYGKNLTISVMAGNTKGELTEEKDLVKTNENTVKATYDNSEIPSFLYEIALQNVDSYLQKANMKENEYDATYNITTGRKIR